MHALKLELNKKWGEIANKPGKWSRAGSIQVLNALSKSNLISRSKKKFICHTLHLKDGREVEFDAVSIAGDLIFINSTKSTVNSRDINSLIRTLETFRDFMPEYADKKAVGILASLSIPLHVIRFVERKGVIAGAVGEELLEVKNRRGFQVKFY